MKGKQLSLFEGERLTLEKAIALSTEYLREYFERYKRVAIAFSGGKDSTATVALVCQLIEAGKIPRPKELTVVYADTRMELPPLHASAMAVLNEVEKRGFGTRIAIAPLDKRFLVYILGRGVPPPNNTTLRWCTQQIKVQPMMKALVDLTGVSDRNESTSRLLMLTGVRVGESAARDQRIALSCSKNGAECGQGWFQHETYANADTFAPILHWRVCHVWDYLLMEEHGFPTSLVAAAYGGDEAAEIGARTGCMGCTLTDKDTALDNLVRSHEYSYLAPLKRLKPIYREMRLFSNRLQKDGSETKKDGSLVANPGRKGPLTLEARSRFLEKILGIQAEVNAGAIALGHPCIDIINAEEEARIRELIALRTFPQKWSGDEPNGAELLPEVYSDGSVQALLW